MKCFGEKIGIYDGTNAELKKEFTYKYLEDIINDKDKVESQVTVEMLLNINQNILLDSNHC
jgi:hypothetical protein